MSLRHSPTDFFTAMAFLTRLVPPGLGTSPMERTLPYFPFVGTVIGGLCVLPLYLGLFQGHALVQGWFYVCLSIYITRGLHADGLADVADGWGSYASGARFWEIVKDSRIGAFGVYALVLGLGGQVLLVAEVLRDKAWGTAFFAMVLGRQAGILMCRAGRDISRSEGMGRSFLKAASGSTLAFTLLITVLLGLAAMPFPALIASIVLTLVGVWVLQRLGFRQGGVNGDFIGAAIVWGELATLIGYLLV